MSQFHTRREERQRGEKRRGERQRGEESGEVMAQFPLMFEESKKPKKKRRGINRYILCNVGEGGNV